MLFEKGLKTRIFLYSKSDEFSIEEIKDYLAGKLKIDVVVRGDFADHVSKISGERKNLERFAREIASFRVLDTEKPFKLNEPIYGEIRYEKRVLEGRAKPGGILYDGIRLHNFFRETISGEERGLDDIHVVFTDRLLGTFDRDDLRYHARSIVCGYPSIISTAGIVEAPAKPREFYIEKQLVPLNDAVGIERLKQKFNRRFIDYNDDRMTEVIKGYAMQAVFYQLFQEAFCEVKSCRLYNAHWQEELINAQMKTPEFCRVHEKMLEGPKKALHRS